VVRRVQSQVCPITSAAEASATAGKPGSATEDPDPTETQAAGVGEEVRDGNFSYVPKGTDVESIELHDGPFSDGVTVGL
jgi:hypothetical protein